MSFGQTETKPRFGSCQLADNYDACGELCSAISLTSGLVGQTQFTRVPAHACRRRFEFRHRLAILDTGWERRRGAGGSVCRG